MQPIVKDVKLWVKEVSAGGRSLQPVHHLSAPPGKQPQAEPGSPGLVDYPIALLAGHSLLVMSFDIPQAESLAQVMKTGAVAGKALTPERREELAQAMLRCAESASDE